MPGIPQPTGLDIFHQVRRDLFGKDVQDNPTASYAWVADQFGHFALGFELTYLLSWVLRGIYGAGNFSIWPPAITVLTIFILKEGLDYLNARSKSTKITTKKFAFDQAEVLWNIVTALGYIGLGITIATLAIAWKPKWLIVALGVGLVLAVGVAIWWLRRKITFQHR